MRSKQLTMIAGLIALTATVAAQSRYQPPASTAALEARIAALEQKLANVTRSGYELTVTGNLNVVNGSRSTMVANGLGNLVLGYNETRKQEANERGGSHNLILGIANSYAGTGGLVSGTHNSILNGVVLGGTGSSAEALGSVVLGGVGNRIPEQGANSVIAGGWSSETWDTEDVIVRGNHLFHGPVD